ncbi:hypothetical protein BV25DRAFT_528861 [Artomyces pyxidatus]|uniref:Uncharacterized protein n=1 Tax=Artomyces pyxidatus TaxID=48021 RepID=A0ACB8TIB2_9AGAM|nr:hypothetical protein BV25DRAFT_528861 [Artomyces pyxidatus]
MALSLAKHAAAALNREKPRSSITEWVDILTSPSYDDEVYDGIPQLIDSIDLQATGPTEASRALRKKMKHGNSHQQYRALVILNALVENSGHKFQTNFADGQLTDAIKNLATDPGTDPKVKKKVLSVLASWHHQFKDDRSLSLIAGLYRQVKPAEPPRRPQVDREALEAREREAEAKRREEKEAKDEAKRRAKSEKEAERERLRQEDEERRRKQKEKSKPAAKSTRKPFNFEQEKPQVLNAIANASSAANNLINAITLVNTEHDSLLTNERVQECLVKTKQFRKPIVRYIQLVEDEEFIGTLIDTNERIISALEIYDRLSKPDVTEKDVEEVQQGIAATHLADSEVQKLQDKQRAAVQRAVRLRERVRDDEEGPRGSNVHPDLQDLSFGSLGAEQRNLQPPIRPNSQFSDEAQVYRRGSLSDFSDYESSDENTHHHRPHYVGPSGSAGRKEYVNVSDDEDTDAHRHIRDEDDPFADPFAD